MSEIDQISNSYENADLLYRLFWNKNSESSLHFGYWKKETKNLKEALLLHKLKLSQFAEIPINAKILDMGCGVGGGAFFLATKFNAKVTGINISKKQLDEARKKAVKLNLTNQINFLQLDYLTSPFDNDSFDVIWAVESFFHCIDKSRFIKECYRLLKPGGILLIADYFASKLPETDYEKVLMKNWFKGFHIPNLLSEIEFENEVARVGFDEFHYKNVSEYVLPSSKKLHLLGAIGVITAMPLRILPERIRQRLPFQEMHARATVCQHKALQMKLWEYGFITARK